MDETGFYQRQSYQRSWSSVGKPCYAKIDANRGKRLNLIGAMSLADLKQVASLYNLTLLYLPPYSPELNPIENKWAVVKQDVRLKINQFDSLRDCVIHCAV
ncbi:transposase [Acinetobacter sp. c1-l78]